ncbi:uncharacterized protein LOC109724655 [Ananas comosus]|uniref:30S ribosomal protein S21 n=1 Tax=Ananas comosus TaxID=4615 RepID=A0A199WA70_ANACO|nr:uncharacterized protein LOC109724655 [Ananas comosus]OAY86126.1 30S ribosomal protein S21 [Ananas comosus]
MAAACSLLHLSFPRTPPSPASPLRSSRPNELPLPFPSRRPFSLLLSSTSFSNLPGPFHVDPAPPRAGYNVQVVVGEDEPEEVLLRRFRREVSKAGVIQECKRRRFFENKQEERKRKAREAGRRNRRR